MGRRVAAVLSGTTLITSNAGVSLASTMPNTHSMDCGGCPQWFCAKNMPYIKYKNTLYVAS